MIGTGLEGNAGNAIYFTLCPSILISPNMDMNIVSIDVSEIQLHKST